MKKQAGALQSDERQADRGLEKKQMRKANIAVLVSGGGTNLQAILDAQETGSLHLAVHRGLAGLVRIAVLVVKSTGAAMADQVRERGQG